MAANRGLQGVKRIFGARSFMSEKLKIKAHIFFYRTENVVNLLVLDKYVYNTDSEKDVMYVHQSMND